VSIRGRGRGSGSGVLRKGAAIAGSGTGDDVVASGGAFGILDDDMGASKRGRARGATGPIVRCPGAGGATDGGRGASGGSAVDCGRDARAGGGTDCGRGVDEPTGRGGGGGADTFAAGTGGAFVGGRGVGRARREGPAM